MFSIFIFLFNFDSKKSIAIYKVGILAASLMNLIHVLRQRSPLNHNELNLDWNLLCFCLPIMVSGNMLGIVFNNYFPGLYLMVVTLGCLILTFTFTILKTRKKYLELKAFDDGEEIAILNSDPINNLEND